MYVRLKCLRSLWQLWLVATLLLCSLSSVPYTHAEGATAVANNIKVVAGNGVQIRGSGFRANERVDSWITGPNNEILVSPSARANRGSNVSISITTSRSWQVGWWAVTLRGVESNAEAVATFQVTVPVADGILDVEPATASRGNRINFHGALFMTDELVQTWVTRSDGRAIPVDEAGSPAYEGEINFSYDVPTDAPTGAWHMTAFGLTSERLLIVSFTVTP